MMKVGVISDTHGLLRQEVLEILRSCDCILHAGDINIANAICNTRQKIFIVAHNHKLLPKKRNLLSFIIFNN